LIERLKVRGSETEESIKKRMEKAEIELNQMEKYDYVVVNDTVENAVNQIKDIIGRKN
jgi:guanylate kinase